MRYSDQAQLIIKNLKDFDKEDFEKWFKENQVIGGGEIIHYLEK